MSTVAPELPVVWRPHRGRLVTHAFAVVVLVVVLVLAVVLPHPFGIADRVGFVVVGAAIAAVLYLLGRCRLRADADGLTVVNVIRTTELEWAEVVGVSHAVGDPWVTLDLDDGDTLPAMGIQAADGERARQAIGELRALLDQWSTA
ncbi:MAG TPA: PH domain-containing protein [Streptosporangiaceae bacterium]